MNLPSAPPDDDRRRFPRLCAPILYRDASWFGPRRSVVDASLGGVRIYSDDALEWGRRLRIDLVLPPGIEVKADARVAWVRALPAGSPATYEVGLEFLTFPAEHLSALASALDPADSSPDSLGGESAATV